MTSVNRNNIPCEQDIVKQLKINWDDVHPRILIPPLTTDEGVICHIMNAVPIQQLDSNIREEQRSLYKELGKRNGLLMKT